MKEVGETLEPLLKTDDFIDVLGFGAKVIRMMPDGRQLEDQQVSHFINMFN